MQIERYNGNKEEWDSYVNNSAKSSLYHLIGWKTVIEKTYGHKSYYLAARGGGKIKGILPLFFISSRLFGSFVVSLPFHCTGGVCADDEEAENMLISEAIRLTKEVGAEYLELRQSSAVRNDNLSSKDRKVTFVLTLSQDPEHIWKGAFCSNLRNKIRKAQRLNLTVTSGCDEKHVEHFYRIYARNMKDLGTPVFARALIDNIVKEFPHQYRLFVAWRGKKALGAKFTMIYKDTMYFIWASSLRKHFKDAPVSLLNWEAVRYACLNGMRFCDLGRSTIDDGAYHFKRQFGGEIRQLHWQYYLNTRRDMPCLNKDNKKFKIAVNIWKRLPIFVTNSIGPIIVKYIP